MTRVVGVGVVVAVGGVPVTVAVGVAVAGVPVTVGVTVATWFTDTAKAVACCRLLSVTTKQRFNPRLIVVPEG
jgi:hypothetical protein